MKSLLQAVNRFSPRGFSLIELIAVMLLLGILGVVALSRLGGLQGYASLGFFNDTVSGLRYAQKRAVASGCRVQARITAAGWQLWQGDSCNSSTYSLPVADPASRSQAYQRSAPVGITITPAANLVFTPQSTVEGIATDQAFAIDGRTFTVHRLSGWVDAL
jgi:MSHA pilin protein MshC